MTSVSNNSNDTDENITTRNVQTNSGILSQICAKLSAVTVEPVLFTYIFGYTLVAILTTDLLLDRVCRITYDGSLEECKNMSMNNTLQVAVEKTTAQINLYSALTINVPSIIVAPVLGAYSDKHGRKIPMMMPFIATVLASIGLMVFAYIPDLSPMWVVVCNVPHGLLGGFCVLLLASYSHVSDTSNIRSRTGRMAVATIALTLGAPGGLLLSSVLFTALGYWPVYAIDSGLAVLALMYITVRIPSGTPMVLRMPADNASASAADDAGRRSLARDACSAVDNGNSTTVADVNYGGDGGHKVLRFGAGVYATLVTCFKPRPHHQRAFLLLLLLAMLGVVTAFGSISFLYLYVKKLFDWSYNSFIYYTVASTLLDVVGTTVMLSVLSHHMGVPDLWLGLVAALFKIAADTITASATMPIMLYVAAAGSMFSLVTPVVIRSQLSKSVSPAELGKVFSLLSSGESILPVVMGPAFTAVFKDTLDTVPGAVFYIAALAYGFTAVIFGVLLGFRASRRGVEEENSPLLQEDESQ